MVSVAAACVFPFAANAVAQNDQIPGSVPRYATDAYPGFDREEGIVISEKKEPRWFAFMNGPKKDNPADQLAWAEACEAAGSLRAARRGYDALVREWPASKEAPVAQERLAELYFSKYNEYIEAFNEYKYLLDYYSTQCDYSKVAARMYETALLMRKSGKRLLFVRFANTVETRRAFEAVVLRAPGADYAPAAMFEVARLRTDDNDYDRAVLVYENLRNMYRDSPEAEKSLLEECKVRMTLLAMHGYNRTRARDTVSFIKMAIREAREPAMRLELGIELAKATSFLEDEAYASARFYDSRTRTKRNAANAYAEFLRDYPASVHASKARARMAELEAESAEKEKSK